MPDWSGGFYTQDPPAAAVVPTETPEVQTDSGANTNPPAEIPTGE